MADKTENVLVVIFGVLIAVAIVFAFTGWLAMISVGIIHANFNWPGRTVSFYQGLALAVPIIFLSSLFRGGSKK